MPFFVLGAAAGVFTAWVERKLIGAEGAEFELTIVERCLIAGRAIWFYLGKLFWPADLDLHLSALARQPGDLVAIPVPGGRVAAVGGVVGVAAAVAWAVGGAAVLRRARCFPVLGFCNVYPFLYSFVADHFQYLASLGIITLASAGVALLLERWRLWDRPAGLCACAGVLLADLGGL